MDLWITEPIDVVGSLWRLKMKEGDSMLYITSLFRDLYVALCEVYAVYAFVTSRLVDVAVHFVCLCVEAS